MSPLDKTNINHNRFPKSRPIKALQEMVDAGARMNDSLAFHVGVEFGAEIWPRLEKFEERQIGISHDVVRRVITLLGVSPFLHCRYQATHQRHRMLHDIIEPVAQMPVFNDGAGQGAVGKAAFGSLCEET